MDHVFSASNISASGLSAERARMEVVAQNIANAHSTRTAGGGPYRRQQMQFAALLNEQLGGVRGGANGFGVRILGIVDDPTELPRIHQPGHPDADAEGFVLMPNVQLPMEMVDLMTANRAYEANLKVLQAFRQQAEQTLALLRGG